MSHFPDVVWADWARGITTGVSGEEIRNHLSSGCEECHASLALWKAVAELGRRDASYEPPTDVLSRAVALFRSHGRDESPAGKAVLLAELVFDSFRSPLPAGIRTLERATRHLGYRAGSFFVDVRIEEQGASGLATVVGQLVQDPKELAPVSVEGCSVLLTSGRATLAKATTNRFGEFSLEMPTERENHLAIRVGDEVSIVVPLSGHSS